MLFQFLKHFNRNNQLIFIFNMFILEIWFSNEMHKNYKNILLLKEVLRWAIADIPFKYAMRVYIIFQLNHFKQCFTFEIKCNAFVP